MNDVLPGVQTEQTFDFADAVRYEVVSTQEHLEEAVKKLSKSDVLAVDTEGTGLDPHTSKTLLIQVADEEICYIFQCYAGLNFDSLRDLLEDTKRELILHNAKYDIKMLLKHHDIYPQKAYDTQIIERVLTNGLGVKKFFSLDDLTYKYLGVHLDKGIRLNFVNRDPIENPITEQEYQYAARDVVLLFTIRMCQMAQLEQHGMVAVKDLESEVVSVLSETELEGVPIDQDKWRSLTVKAEEKLVEIADRILEILSPLSTQPTLFGVPTMNLNSQQDLLNGLGRLGFQLTSTGEEVLKAYKKEHEVFRLLLDYRGWSKISSSYGVSFLKKVHEVTKRIHANFNQVEADTGRMSASKPNLQQVPGYDEKDPDALNFRSCFIAPAGYKLITADYSQQELRILADMSDDPTFAKAYLETGPDGKFLDVHTYTASIVFEIPYEKIGPKSNERKKAKVINFFLVYGGGANALAENLECSIEDAEKIIEAYFKRFPKIKQFLNRQAALAKHNLYSTTISGRKRFYSLPHRESEDYPKVLKQIERRGKNTGIQGSGADVTKKAAVLFRNKVRELKLDARIIMIVHDEFVVLARQDHAETTAKVLEESMKEGWSCYFKKIPMIVDAVVAESWEK